MTRYDIITDHFEINLNDRRTPAYHAHVRHGLTADEILALATQADNGQHVVDSYDDLDAARTALTSKWAPLASTRFSRSFAGIPLLTGEYYAIQENEYDEDGEWTGGGDLWDYVVEPYELETTYVCFLGHLPGDDDLPDAPEDYQIQAMSKEDARRAFAVEREAEGFQVELSTTSEEVILRRDGRELCYYGFDEA